MSNQNQEPSLFDQIPDTSGEAESVLSPSEQFRLANPDYIEPERIKYEWDPNTRNIERQRRSGAGGGLAAAAAGELIMPGRKKSIVPLYIPEDEKRTPNNLEAEDSVPMPDDVKKAHEQRKAKTRPFSINNLSDKGFTSSDAGATEFLDKRLKKG